MNCPAYAAVAMAKDAITVATRTLICFFISFSPFGVVLISIHRNPGKNKGKPYFSVKTLILKEEEIRKVRKVPC